jgi:hypothetical protein
VQRALEPVFRRLHELGITPNTPHGVAEGDAAQSEVIDRITRHAEELCAQWRTAASGQPPPSAEHQFAALDLEAKPGACGQGALR